MAICLRYCSDVSKQLLWEYKSKRMLNLYSRISESLHYLYNCFIEPNSRFKMATVGFIVACLLTVSQAVNPLFRDMVVHESTTIPGGFVENGAASSSEVLKLRVALTQNNIKGLESELYAVSDPASPRYGQHLSKGEVSTVPIEKYQSLINTEILHRLRLL